MTIGPEAAHSTPGRIVVTIAYFVILGAFATVAGLGPLVVTSAVEIRFLGAVACACGAMLVVGGIALMVRARTGRRIAAAAGRAALGLTVIGLVVGSTTIVGATRAPVDMASVVAGMIVLVAALGNGFIALATLRAIQATRTRYFRGEAPLVHSMQRHRSTPTSDEHRATTI